MFEPSYSTYANYARGNKWRNVVMAAAISCFVLLLGGWMFAEEIEASFEHDMQNGIISWLSSNDEENNESAQIALANDADVLGEKVEKETPDPPKITRPQFQGDDLPEDYFTAESVLVKDNESNTILYTKKHYQPRPLASITKLMSVLVLLERDINWQATTTMVSDDIVDPHVISGRKYTMEELWNAALIGSSNKSILALIDGSGWNREKFIIRMNERAGELGMFDTHFVEPTGLDARNISTASDVLILLEEALSFERIKVPLLKREYSLSNSSGGAPHDMWNTSWILLRWIPHTFDNYYGGKTGFIPAAGYNFAMQVGYEGKGSISVVVLGTNSNEARFVEARDIAEWTYENYLWPDELNKEE